VFRRNGSNAPATAVTDLAPQPPVQPGKQSGKGRPTPKRSEVERQRRQPYSPPPADRKAASAHRKSEYQRTRDAARRGEEWALKPADRGPVRALARDYIDSRRLIISEYVLFVAFIAILLILFLGAAANSLLVLYLEIAIVALIGVESTYHSGRVTKLARERLPGESTRGLTLYVAKRAMRLRMSREPQARVQRGDSI
jgi:Protein of unknown function (DUF3043)